MVCLEKLVAGRSTKLYLENYVGSRGGAAVVDFIPVRNRYYQLVQKAAEAPTKKYFGMLKEVFEESGLISALRFDADVTAERHGLSSRCNYRKVGYKPKVGLF